MTIPEHAWMVRAGNSNELADLVAEENAVAIGWAEMGDLSSLKTREQFKERYPFATARCVPATRPAAHNENP